MPLPAPHPVGPAVRATPPERFGNCARVLFAPPERAPGERAGAGVLEEIAYRRCPVGLIASVDCPELVGARCLHHEPLGERPKAVVPRAEVALLAAELAASGYLTEAYRRRVRGLRIAPPPMRPLAPGSGPAAPSSPTAAPVRRSTVPADRAAARVNVPSDAARQVAAARRVAPEAGGSRSA